MLACMRVIFAVIFGIGGDRLLLLSRALTWGIRRVLATFRIIESDENNHDVLIICASFNDAHSILLHRMLSSFLEPCHLEISTPFYG